MPRFRVTFRKIVYGNTGHPCEICQRIVDVNARDSTSAETAAIESFCDLESVANWLDHADRLEITRMSQAAVARPLAEGAVRRAA